MNREASRIAFVAAEVRANLARNRVSQVEAAGVAGIGQASMSRRLAGEYPFTVDELFRLADHLKIDVRSFFPSAQAVAS
ncbi:helix-turn-helix domain-containing protein [Mycobacteroides chelonae]|uniref:helix-turn-helix domain-containing protein n=1 Tax=Mycobacteroides chelonae TaxID=1774 RepID=UPI000991958A|nr:helix-turn-helix transcriptional regulator [Mycobacteroides chelonae]